MHFNILLFLTFLFSCAIGDAASLLGVRIADQGPETVRLVFEFNAETPIQQKITQHTLSFSSPHKSPNFSVRSKSSHLNLTIKPAADPLLFKAQKNIKNHKAFWIKPGKKYPYYRYVVDLSLGMPAPKKTSPPAPSAKPKAPPPKKTILIDAGHGGKDPGTVGIGRVFEKNVTLKAAKLLAKKLKKTGRYTPVLIRPKDQAMLISRRLRKAKNARGDLFISLHADSCGDKNVRGLSLYTLSSVASDQQAARLALKENKADLIMGVDLQSEIPEVANILIDLTKREKKNLSSKLAQHLLNKLRYRIFLLQKPHRFANFYILKVPGLPSVLIELGYLTHKKEAKLLQTHRHLDNICQGIIEAIDSYFKTEIHETRA